MLAKLSQNVVCIKDIPSNLIEEAFFILKSSIDVEETKSGRVKKQIIMEEINGVIDEYSQQLKMEMEEKRKQAIESKIRLRTIKVRTFVGAVIFVICTIIFAIMRL